MYYRYSTLLEQRSTSKLGIYTPLSSYISSFLHDDLENDNLGNDDLENDDLENDDLENDNLENDDLENDDLENDDLENDDGDGETRRIKRLEVYRRREIRGR